jgi:hypothetical protein
MGSEGPEPIGEPVLESAKSQPPVKTGRDGAPADARATDS